MSLSRSESFRAGFLMKCAEDGLTQPEIDHRAKMASCLMEKDANAFLNALSSIFRGATSVGGAAIRGAGSAIGPLAKAVAWPALALPAVGGGLVGYLAAKSRYGDDDVEAAQKQNLIAEYQRLADDAKRRHELNSLRQERLYG